ncbi:helix-turn-helix transcriptional regulator [Paraburkholderia atlantica]|uniref:Two component transcriptional regulator, AraC family n=1 Tax=Paraburkholderia atlantica TaxID=2654982 RepID=D5WNH9_PARAM|nr:AraC family transcriptional regulator [Paraburkholderia atlantica]ADG20858.1 two component transcriptional regulator, AraC family [Paraburkholderia atlantica]MBB5510928.1 AraC-like DNA-binding protein [Paraburkholderia atlantica]
MSDIPTLDVACHACEFLWVDLMHDPNASILNAVRDTYEVCRVRELNHVSSAIRLRAPAFVCFEVDDPDTRVFDSLMRVRNDHPELPVLVITDRNSMVVAKWAVRLRVWDLLVKPLGQEELSETICSIASKTTERDTAIGSGGALSASSSSCDVQRCNTPGHLKRTSAAISHLKANFACRISLETVAAACRLSPSQFCRVFRKEHDVSFGQYLLCFRMDRARTLLENEKILVKEVAYAVGFTDLSYFTRSFKRHFAVCPTAYQAGARHASE